MFERFNDSARGAVVQSSEEARSLGAEEISTGHFLLALMTSVRGEHNKAVEVLLALRILPQTVREAMLAALPAKVDRAPAPSIAFTQETKKALELSLRGALLLGQNYIGPEHLLYGLTRNAESAAGRVLAGLGITYEKIHRVIEGKTPEESPTAARTCDVYMPVGKSVFKNGGKIYPDLATAQAGNPDQEIAPLSFTLHEGEFFDVGAALPENRFKSWGSFADYPAAFAAASDFSKNASGYDIVVRILSPDVQELHGKDSQGRDVILGRSVEYHRSSLISRLAAAVD